MEICSINIYIFSGFFVFMFVIMITAMSFFYIIMFMLMFFFFGIMTMYMFFFMRIMIMSMVMGVSVIMTMVIVMSSPNMIMSIPLMQYAHLNEIEKQSSNCCYYHSKSINILGIYNPIKSFNKKPDCYGNQKNDANHCSNYLSSMPSICQLFRCRIHRYFQSDNRHCKSNQIRRKMGCICINCN